MIDPAAEGDQETKTTFAIRKKSVRLSLEIRCDAITHCIKLECAQHDNRESYLNFLRRLINDTPVLLW